MAAFRPLASPRGLRRTRPPGQFVPDLPDLRFQLAERSVVVDHEVRDGQPLRARGLGRHAGPRLGLVHAPEPYEPVELGPGGRVHDHDQVVERREAVLGEQGYVVDDDVPGPRPALQLGRPGADQGVDDGIEGGQALGVGEHDGAELRPVERPLRGEDAVAEGLHDGREPRGAGLHDLAGDPVRVDQDGPVRDEQP